MKTTTTTSTTTSQTTSKKVTHGQQRLIVLKNAAGIQPPVLIENNEFIRIFRISSSTSREWRRKGFLPFIRISCKVYFRLQDVEHFLETHSLFNPTSSKR